MLFTRRQQALIQRQAVLQQRGAALRATLTQQATVLLPPLGWADRALAGLRWLKHHPQWVAAGTAALMVWRPRRAARLAGRAWATWRLWQRLQRWRAAVGPATGNSR